jgi:hypothetical protein
VYARQIASDRARSRWIALDRAGSRWIALERLVADRNKIFFVDNLSTICRQIVDKNRCFNILLITLTGAEACAPDP